jgi:hypothetical protein
VAAPDQLLDDFPADETCRARDEILRHLSRSLHR